jgi:adenylate cyclase
MAGDGHETARALRRVLQGVIVGAAAAVIAGGLWLAGVLGGFEAKTWDLRARLMARPGPATGRVVTILLDQQSLNWAKNEQGWGWPWPREVYGAIASFCQRAGARALVIDVLFTEPSSVDPADDKAFGQGLSDYGRVVGAMNLAKEQGDATAWPAEVPAPRLVVTGTIPRALDFPRAQFPIAELSRNARVLANVTLPADPLDGVYRAEPLFNTFGGKTVPSEALAAWMAGTDGDPSVRIEPGRLLVGSTTVPIDAAGRALLRYRGPSQTHMTRNAAAVLQSELLIRDGQKPTVDPALFKDKYVFFGFTAPGLFDLKPTPMSGSYPGVEVNATMLDNLLSGDFMRPVPVGATIALLLVLCLGAAIAVSSIQRAGLSVIMYVVFVPLGAALSIGTYALGYWLQVVALELGTVIALVGSSLASYATEGRQKRFIKGAFSQYLSPVVIEELIAHPESLKLGGEKRELTIFFSDVQGFTTISEKLAPEDLVALLNEYLTAMVDIIQEEGGTIDKFEGDAIIAFWNAPLDFADHAVRGVRAALRCQAKLAEMRPSIQARIGKGMHMRVGMNTGDAVVGNMGSKTRFDYTMLGDQVNLSARLEGINKQFGTYFMVSKATAEKLGGAYPVRELSCVAVVGRKEPVTVFEPMFPERYAEMKPALEVFARGLAEFYAGHFEEAARIFDETAAADPPAEHYARKCRALIAEPPAKWAGVWEMTEK